MHIVVAESIGLLPSDRLISYLCCQQTLCLTKWPVSAVKWKCISPFIILATGVSRDKQKSKSQIFTIVQPKQMLLVHKDDGKLRTFVNFFLLVRWMRELSYKVSEWSSCHDDRTNWNRNGTAWHNCLKTSLSEKTDKEIIIRVIIGLDYNYWSLSGKLVDYSQQPEWLPLTRHRPSSAPNLMRVKLRWLLLCFFMVILDDVVYKCSSPIYWKSGHTHLSFGCNISRWSKMHRGTVAAWIMSGKNSARTLSGNKKLTWQTF